jgi:hypothetical protein
MCAGGIIVCHGSECSVTFTGTHFLGCTVVALAGATVTLSNCTSQNSTNGPSGVSILASGDRTAVLVDGGSIIGGAHGIAVQKGACVKASNLSVTRCFVVGIECRDTGSSIELMNCNVSHFSEQCTEVVDITGVLARAGCSAIISACTLEAVPYGVDIQTKANASITGCQVAGCKVTGLSVSSGGRATIAECTVQRCGVAAVHFFEEGTFASITDCELSGSEQHGVLVSNSGRGVVQRCQLLKNGSGGAWVSFSGMLTISRCSSVGNGSSGYWAESGMSLVLHS